MKKLLISGVSVVALGLATTAMAGNVSTVDQIGVNNNANVDQTLGNNGKSDINQSNSSGAGDTASVTQSDGLGGGTAVTNDALIDQIGGSGSQLATINQSNSSDGTVNAARITQNNTQGDNTGAISQDGTGNTASIDQGPAGANVLNCGFFGCSTSPTTPLSVENNDADIAQTGNGNSATAAQIMGSNGGSNNSIDIDQNGDDNTANVLQGTGDLAGVSLPFIGFIPNPASNDNFNSASIDQMGNMNTSQIEQGGELGAATNIQNGSMNDSVIVQSGGVAAPGFGNTAFVEQSGSGNSSNVQQTSLLGDLPALPAANNAVVFQNGMDNISTVDQNPSGGHSALVTQNGDDNNSDVNQSGLLNSAIVAQATQDNTSIVNQDGGLLLLPAGNSANVSQGVLTGTQNNFSQITQQGVSNTSSVMQ